MVLLLINVLTKIASLEDDLGAIFPKEIWSQADNIKVDGKRVIRSNNHLESFHGKMKKKTSKHPNIFIFIEKIKQEQESQELNLRLIRNGIDPYRKQAKKYADASTKLANLRFLLEENEITPFEFAGKCAAVTKGQKI